MATTEVKAEEQFKDEVMGAEEGDQEVSKHPFSSRIMGFLLMRWAG